jgi:membrane dipeptidase
MLAWHRRLRAVSDAVRLESHAAAAAEEIEPPLLERAKAIHAKAISIDTHIDINPGNFTPEKSYADRLDSQVNLVKMEEGGLDAVFLVAYVGQVPDFTPEGFARAHENVMLKFDAIHRLCNELAPDRCELATTAADVRRIKAAGKSAILIGVENGYSMGEDIGNVEKFYNLGARYMSLAHNGHSHLIDSHTRATACSLTAGSPRSVGR